MEPRDAIADFKRGIERLYGPRLRKLLLYGSCARGDATADSDVDLLVVLEGDIIPGREINRMIDLVCEVNSEHGVLLAVVPVSEDEYRTVRSPLLVNVRREGVEA